MKRKNGDASLESKRRAILAHMAATRAELSACCHLIEVLQRKSRSGQGIGLPSIAGPTGTAIGVALAGCVILGPRRVAMTACRAALVALIGRASREIVR